jgi:NH3-dependent NAD+ synthetase
MPSKTRLLANLITSTGDVKSASLDNVVASGGGGGLDSALVTQLIDSSYVQLREGASGGVDSATTLNLVDFEKGVFRINGQTLDSDHTIDSADNAMSAGPVTVDSGVTLTVNGYWSVV